MAKKTADKWFSEYGDSHQNATNKLLHWICVPAIVASLIGLVWCIPQPAAMQSIAYLNWATILISAAMVFYLRLSIPLALGMLAFLVLLVFVIARLDQLGQPPLWQIALAVFVLAWVGQFIGHKVEGKKPSFFQDIQFLLIGPIWLLAFIYRRVGIAY